MENTRCPGCMKLKTSGPVCEHCGYDDTKQNASHQLPIGTVLKEQYQIGKVLGQGGFGITYLGWDLYLDIPVAIKEYYPSGTVMRESTVTFEVADVTGDDGARFRNNRDRFMREAKMLARFSQMPEVVQIKNFFLANNTAYIVMEYVDGITLKQYVKNQGGKLSIEETFAILGPVIQTLAKVHKTGIIHRDISPDNIMMVPGGAKLLDFGAVRDVSGASVDRELTKSTEAILKQGYAPMEQYQKKGALGPWTDVYALCATIYYCLTGEVPPDSPARVLEYEVLDFDRLVDLTQQQKKALIHGLELRADKRTASMEELYQELFYEQPEPVPEPQPEPVSVSKPEPRPITEVESKPITKVQSKPITKVESRPITKVESKLVTEADPKPVTKVETKRDPKPKSKLWMFLGLCAVAAVVLISVMALSNNSRPAGQTAATEQVVPENVVSGDCGATMTWELDLDTGVMTIDGYGDMYDFYLPDASEEQRLNLLPRPWEDHVEKITEVRLTNLPRSIGNFAFTDCINLKTVDLGIYIQRIGAQAFRNTGLEQIQLADTPMSIEHEAFYHTQLREVTIPLFVESISHAAFADCPNLERVEILGSTYWNYDIWSGVPVFCRENGSVEGITLCGPSGGIVEDYAGIFGYTFESNGNQVSFEGQGDFRAFPGNADGRWYFDKESNFLKIQGEMPSDMVGQWEIDSNQVDPHRQSIPRTPWKEFQDDIYIVSIGDGVTRIPNNAFAHCWKLADIYLPDSVRSIGFQSFLDCELDEIYIPDSVTEISDFAFNYCQNLWMARLPIGLPELNQGVFNACPKLEAVYAGNRTQFFDQVHMGYPVTPFTNTPSSEGHLDETAFPENLVIYVPQANLGISESPATRFAKKYNLAHDEQIFGHQNAEVFGASAFGNTDVYWALEDGVLTLLGQGETPFFRSGNIDRNAWHTMQFADVTWPTEAPWYPYRNEITTVVVEDGITVLNRGILCDMPNLESVDLGSVQKIYDGAIDNCGITELVLPESMVHVHKGAIQDCIDLKVIHVENGSEKLDHGMIRGCSNLKELRFWSGAENISPNFDLFDGDIPQNLVIFAKHDSDGLAYAQRCGITYEKLQ